MAFRQRKKKKQNCKPNVIPILDAVFIFIFFLLMSAQFLEIYQIGSDAPSVQTISEDNKDKRPPLNLTLVVNADHILIQTGLEAVTKKRIGLKDGNYDLTLLNLELIEIKKNNIGENSVIIKPDSKVEYKKLVYIMDSCREVPNKASAIVAKNKNGKVIETRTLFEQIIFETLI